MRWIGLMVVGVMATASAGRAQPVLYPDQVYSGRWMSQVDSLEGLALQEQVVEAYQTSSMRGLELAEKALDYARKHIKGGDHPDLATSLNNVALFFVLSCPRSLRGG